jgi:hypothetical protein
VAPADLRCALGLGAPAGGDGQVQRHWLAILAEAQEVHKLLLRVGFEQFRAELRFPEEELTGGRPTGKVRAVATDLQWLRSVPAAPPSIRPSFLTSIWISSPGRHVPAVRSPTPRRASRLASAQFDQFG